MGPPLHDQLPADEAEEQVKKRSSTEVLAAAVVAAVHNMGDPPVASGDSMAAIDA